MSESSVALGNGNLRFSVILLVVGFYSVLAYRGSQHAAQPPAEIAAALVQSALHEWFLRALKLPHPSVPVSSDGQTFRLPATGVSDGSASR